MKARSLQLQYVKVQMHLEDFILNECAKRRIPKETQFKDTARTELPMEVLPWVHPYKHCEVGSYDPNWQSHVLV